MKYYIIAGEASGDLHGGNLIRSLKAVDPQAQVRCWGGDHMRSAGGILVRHIRDLAFMGFWEVITHLPTILKNLALCRRDITAFDPDVLIFIDYPGFNLRIASWAKKQHFKTVYYISPQVWAWKESRVEAIKRNIDEMIVILPFEKEFYARWNYPVHYVGHPLTTVMEDAQKKPLPPLASRPIIALLPGSRHQEIQRKLPIMLQVVESFPDYQFVVAQAPGLPSRFYDQMIGDHPVMLLEGQTHALLQQAHAALVTSGTATLETALSGVPQVVCYLGNPLSYWLAKRLIKVPYISLVNLIMEKEVVRELIQKDLNPERLKKELRRILEGSVRNQILQDYTKLKEILGQENASLKAAKIIYRLAGDPAHQHKDQGQ